MNIKSLLIFAAGLTIGSVGSYFLTKESMRVKMQQEVNEMHDYYARLYGKKTTEKPETTNPDGIVLAANKDTRYSIAKTDINTVASDYHTESDLVKDEKTGETKHITSTYTKPYILSDEEWETTAKYCKYTYRWYHEHQVMIHVDEETGDSLVIDDPYGHVGLDNLEELEESADGYIYVRNDNRGEDYEVVLFSGEPDIDVNTWEPAIPPDDEDEYD